MAKINSLTTLVILVTFATLVNAYTVIPKKYHHLCEMQVFWPGQPTLVDQPYFKKSDDVEFVWKALQQQDGNAVFKLAHLGSIRSRVQRQEIMEALKAAYSVDLINDYLHKKTFDSELGALVRALFMPRAEFFATELRWAVEGVGTDENTLTDILCCLDPQEITAHNIVMTYARLYKVALRHDIAADVRMDTYGKLLQNLATERRLNTTNYITAISNAMLYFKDSQTEDFLHLSEKSPIVYWKFFARRSYEEIYTTSNGFYKIGNSKLPFTTYLERVTTLNWQNIRSGDFWELFSCGTNFRDLLLAIGELNVALLSPGKLNFSTDKIKYYLDLFKKGLDEEDNRRLIRIVALRADKDLELINQLYKENSGGAHSDNLAELIFKQTPNYSYKSESNYVRLLLSKIIICGTQDPDQR